jgi:hypothetical protein
MDRLAMGLLLSPLIASFFVKDLEEMALSRVAYKPICWFWPHGLEKLNDILNNLNSMYLTIQFTMGTEPDGHHSHLPFLGIDVCRRPDVFLGHTVSVKQIHIRLHLNA